MYRASIRKKRRFTPSTAASQAVELLQNDSEIKVQETTLEESKVINYLNKLGKDQPSDNSKETLSFKIVVSLSEGAYFEENLDRITLNLRENFKVKDVTLSPVVPGTVEQFLTVFGKLDAISKASAYIAFILRMVLNRDKFQAYTLKSQNYSLDVLFSQSRTIPHNVRNMFGTGLTYLDTSFPSQYHPTLGAVKIRANFSTIYNLMMHLGSEFVEVAYLDDTRDLKRIPAFGRHTDANLFVRSEKNSSLLAHSNKQLHEFVAAKGG